MADKTMIEATKENGRELADVLTKAFNDWLETKDTKFIDPILILAVCAGFTEHLLSAGPCRACHQRNLFQAGTALIRSAMEMGEPKHLQDEVRH